MEFLRLPAERLYEKELTALAECEKNPVPRGWRLSPRSVLLYILGGKAGDTVITPKYIGSAGTVELCVATLMTDRALLLVGPPGTAKSRLSEHLAAAVSGDSGLLVQGTMGTAEEHLKYGWNYAMLIADGPSEPALVKSPVYRAMEDGKIARVEELTRCLPEVQDCLISLLSEKSMAIPELGRETRAAPGFSLIATANTADRGINELSSALGRRFARVALSPPATLEEEISIVRRRAEETAALSGLTAALPDSAVRKIVTIIRELRQGQTLDGAQRLRPMTSSCSAAEAISVLTGALALAEGFGDGVVTDAHLAALLPGTLVRDEDRDGPAFEEYRRTVLRARGEDFRAIYENTEA